MFCDACGQSNRDEARFCKACGKELGVDAVPPTRELRTPGSAASGVPEEVRNALADKFEVGYVLGRGGMGTVYLALERDLDRQVAIKVLHGRPGAEERNVQRFLQEARLAARLRHPGIVSIHGVGESRGLYYYTMDYIEGETLGAFVEGRHPQGIPPAKAASILRDIVDAVHHAHGSGIIHRDLKPGNIMIDRAGHVLVLDFGLAKVQTAAGITTSGIVVGTPQYISPEQIEGKPATVLSDIYAIGLIYYFMLTGRDLIDAEDAPAVVLQHLTGGPTARVASDRSLPDEAARLITAMLARDPAGRPPTLAAVRASLDGKEVDRASEPAAPISAVPATVPSSPRPDASEAQAFLADADKSLRAGAYDSALRSYSRALSRDNRSERAWFGHVRCLLGMEQWSEATTWADRALSLFPGSVDILAAKAAALGRSGREDEAITLSDEGMKLSKRSAFAWWARGDILASTDLDAARECFETARVLRPYDAELLLAIGRTLLSAGRPAEARDALSEASRLQEDHPVIWHCLGIAHRELAEFIEAEDALQRSLALEPQNAEAQRLLRELGTTGWLGRRLERMKLGIKKMTRKEDT